MNNQIETIIFDLGGVLVDWNPEYLYRKVFNGDEEKVHWFLKSVCTSKWNMKQDEGRTIEEAVNIKVAEFPQYEKWIRLFYNEWSNMFSGPIAENVALFKKLKVTKKYKIYALTNWSGEKWEEALKLFPFFNDFDGVVVSGKEKTIKPNLKIYKILLNRFNISPEKAIFIDDKKENIVAANQLKLNGIHYTNHKYLLQLLKSYNIMF